MGEILKMFLAVLLVLCALAAVEAETHHVPGGGWISAASDRVFRVGDKISFSHPEVEEPIVELQSLEDLLSCNLANPIRMYTDNENHVVLEKAGLRYFASGNLEKCKNGLKLPVSVQPYEHDPEHIQPPYAHDPERILPPYEPEPTPFEPEPTPVKPEPAPVTPKPDPKPEPKPEPEPKPKPEPVDPEDPPYKPPVVPYPVPTPPVEPSSSTLLSGFSHVFVVGLVLFYMSL